VNPVRVTSVKGGWVARLITEPGQAAFGKTPGAAIYELGFRLEGGAKTWRLTITPPKVQSQEGGVRIGVL